MVMAHLLHTDLLHLGEIVYKEVNVPFGMAHAYFSWNDYVAAHRATGYRQENHDGKNEAKDVKRFE